jgi:hypothetical protein
MMKQIPTIVGTVFLVLILIGYSHEPFFIYLTRFVATSVTISSEGLTVKDIRSESLMARLSPLTDHQPFVQARGFYPQPHSCHVFNVRDTWESPT